MAAYRLHRGLLLAGHDSQMLVQQKWSHDPQVHVMDTGLGAINHRQLAWAERTLTRLLGGPMDTLMSPAFLATRGLQRQIARLRPDVIHLHWLGGASMSVNSIAALATLDAPVVMTMHDMWAFTGGCHYDYGCGRYTRGCGNCPQISRRGSHDLSARTVKRKQTAWKNLDITLVGPSRWMAAEAARSILFHGRPVHVIANGVDTSIYRPRPAAETRQHYGLPQEKPLVLFGAMPHGAVDGTQNARKGFDLLQAAARKLKTDVHFAVFGTRQSGQVSGFSQAVQYTGWIDGGIELARLYAAADVTVVPSRQDNLPNTVIESMACGTPVAGFAIGGMPDLIAHGQNGYLAEPFNSADLAAGIEFLLAPGRHTNRFSLAARHHAEEFLSLQASARNYLTLYDALLRKGRHTGPGMTSDLPA